MIRFFDASALVKRYVDEPGSDRVSALIERGAAAVSRLSEVEVASAVARRCREGDLTARQRDRILSALAEDLGRLFVVELTPAVVARARALVARRPLRAGDALQLAALLALGEEVGGEVELVSFDDRLTAAAESEPRPGRAG